MISGKEAPSEAYFRDHIQYKVPALAQEIITKELGNSSMLDLFQYLQALGINFEGSVLELGAGNCWCSALLSKLGRVRKVYAFDFSKNYIFRISPVITAYLKASEEKITKIIGDFHNLPFKDNNFDFVVFSGALHHAENVNSALLEAKRVLKKGGQLIAIREPVCPAVCANRKTAWGRKNGWINIKETECGVRENIYCRKEWKEIFKKAGFSVRFFPFARARTLKGMIAKYTPIRFFNGILYSTEYVFVLKPSEIA